MDLKLNGAERKTNRALFQSFLILGFQDGCRAYVLPGFTASPRFMKSLLCSNLVSQQMIHRLSGLHLKCTEPRDGQMTGWSVSSFRQKENQEAGLKAQESEISFFSSCGRNSFNIRCCNDINISTGRLQSLCLVLCILTLTHCAEECACLVCARERFWTRPSCILSKI